MLETLADPQSLFIPLDGMTMDLGTLLDATIGLPGHDTAAGSAKTQTFLATLSVVQQAELLKAMDCDQDAFLASRGPRQSYLGVAVFNVAISFLCTERIEWTSELALHAFAACRRRRFYQGLGGVATLRAMANSGVSFQSGAAREHEFAALIDAFNDAGEGGKIREAAHQLFGRMYVPRPVSSQDALIDEPFQAFMKRLIEGLHHVAELRERVRLRYPEWYVACSRQAIEPHIFLSLKPKLHPLKVVRLPEGVTKGFVGRDREFVLWRWDYAFRNPDLVPIDCAWATHHADAYRRWEKAHGDARWIEHLTPSLPPQFPPALAELMSTATAGKPSVRWMKALKALINKQEADCRSGVLAMLGRLGSADDVQLSETAWADAGLLAFLHLEYRSTKRRGYELAIDSLPQLSHLPWIDANGKTLLLEGIPPNPITISEENTVFARGLVWAASYWRDRDVINAIHLAAQGAVATLNLGHKGPRLRSLALFNSCVWALRSIGSPATTSVLEELKRHATDPRARKVLEATAN